MQTFLPYPDFKQSAACLDNKRLGKQRVECLQILKALACGQYQCVRCKSGRTSDAIPCNTCGRYMFRKTPWYNHPAVQMWKDKKHALALYACHICFEWRKRGYIDNVVQQVCSIMGWTNDLEISLRELSFDALYPKYDYPIWLGNAEFHASHRSNLLRKNPEHYKQFNWSEPNNLSYIWPTKHLTPLFAASAIQPLSKADKK